MVRLPTLLSYQHFHKRFFFLNWQYVIQSWSLLLGLRPKVYKLYQSLRRRQLQVRVEPLKFKNGTLPRSGTVKLHFNFEKAEQLLLKRPKNAQVNSKLVPVVKRLSLPKPTLVKPVSNDSLWINSVRPVITTLKSTTPIKDKPEALNSSELKPKPFCQVPQTVQCIDLCSSSDEEPEAICSPASSCPQPLVVPRIASISGPPTLINRL